MIELNLQNVICNNVHRQPMNVVNFRVLAVKQRLDVKGKNRILKIFSVILDNVKALKNIMQFKMGHMYVGKGKNRP